MVCFSCSYVICIICTQPNIQGSKVWSDGGETLHTQDTNVPALLSGCARFGTGNANHKQPGKYRSTNGFIIASSCLCQILGIKGVSLASAGFR